MNVEKLRKEYERISKRPHRDAVTVNDLCGVLLALIEEPAKRIPLSERFPDWSRDCDGSGRLGPGGLLKCPGCPKCQPDPKCAPAPKVIGVNTNHPACPDIEEPKPKQKFPWLEKCAKIIAEEPAAPADPIRPDYRPSTTVPGDLFIGIPPVSDEPPSIYGMKIRIVPGIEGAFVAAPQQDGCTHVVPVKLHPDTVMVSGGYTPPADERDEARAELSRAGKAFSEERNECDLLRARLAALEGAVDVLTDAVASWCINRPALPWEYRLTTFGREVCAALDALDELATQLPEEEGR